MLKPTTPILIIALTILLSSCLKDPFDNGVYKEHAEWIEAPESMLADSFSTYNFEVELAANLRDSSTLVVVTDYGTLSKSVDFSGTSSSSLTFLTGPPSIHFHLKTLSEEKDTCTIHLAIGERYASDLLIPITPAYPEYAVIEVSDYVMDNNDTLELTVQLHREFGNVTDGIPGTFSSTDTTSTMFFNHTAFSEYGQIKLPVITSQSDSNEVVMTVSIENGPSTVLEDTVLIRVQ